MSLSNSQNFGVLQGVIIFQLMLQGADNICKNCMFCREWCVGLAPK